MGVCNDRLVLVSKPGQSEYITLPGACLEVLGSKRLLLFQCIKLSNLDVTQEQSRVLSPVQTRAGLRHCSLLPPSCDVSLVVS